MTETPERQTERGGRQRIPSWVPLLLLVLILATGAWGGWWYYKHGAGGEPETVTLSDEAARAAATARPGAPGQQLDREQWRLALTADTGVFHPRDNLWVVKSQPFAMSVRQPNMADFAINYGVLPTELFDKQQWESVEIALRVFWDDRAAKLFTKDQLEKLRSALGPVNMTPGGQRYIELHVSPDDAKPVTDGWNAYFNAADGSPKEAAAKALVAALAAMGKSQLPRTKAEDVAAATAVGAIITPEQRDKYNELLGRAKPRPRPAVTTKPATKPAAALSKRKPVPTTAAVAKPPAVVPSAAPLVPSPPPSTAATTHPAP